MCWSQKRKEVTEVADILTKRKQSPLQKDSQEIEMEQANMEQAKTERIKTEQPKIESQSVEELFENLEQVVAKLESGACSLEEAFSYYEQGVRMVRECDARLDKVEKQILVLQEEGSDYGI